MEWSEIAALVIKGVALWAIWECGRAMRKIAQTPPNPQLEEIVDAMARLHELSTAMDGPRRLERPEPRQSVK